MVNSGFSDAIGSWRMTAIRRPRIRRRWRWGMPVSSAPSKRTRPPTMRAPRGRSPTIERQVVVLPLPDSPTSPSVSPAPRAKLTPSTARMTRAPPKVRKWVWRSETSRTGGIGSEPLQVPELGMEADAQPVAEELARQHDEQDAQSGEHREPPLPRHQGGARLREHEAPGGLGRGHPDAQEAQRRLRDDDDPDGQARQHRRRVQHVRQDVPLDHAPLVGTRDLGQLHELALAQRQDLAADDAR